MKIRRARDRGSPGDAGVGGDWAGAAAGSGDAATAAPPDIDISGI
jgi:hypothetical protein